MKQLARLVCLAICLGTLLPGEAAAGPYSDELAKCLVRSTTAAEKNMLIKWIFAAAALHPEVKGIASITVEQRDELSKSTAKMVEHLVSESCKAEVTDAMKYEGPGALGASFQVLGQVAAMGLFSDPGVSSFMRDFTKYVDVRKMQSLASPK